VSGVGVGRKSIGDDAIIVYLRSEDVKERLLGSIGEYSVENQIGRHQRRILT
jgi:hypothetical protein